MRAPSFAYPRAAMQAQVIAAIERGMPQAVMASLPSYPTRQTIRRWAKADPGFAQNLAIARAWAAGERRGRAIAAHSYDPARAEAFLLEVRRGTPVRTLVKRAEWPNRDRLDVWKHQRPDFAKAIVDAAQFARDGRDPDWTRFDQTVADQVVLRLSKGETVPQISRDPHMPGETALRRWRRRYPHFDTVLKIAKGAGHRRRMQGRSACTTALTEAIAHHIIHGGSLRSAAQSVANAPHHVTLYAWTRRHRDFAAEIARAKRFRDDMLIDRILDGGARDTSLRQRLGQLTGGARPR